MNDRIANANLKDYLQSIPDYNGGIFVAKGREIKRHYVHVKRV
jgi:hypothetical protein